MRILSPQNHPRRIELNDEVHARPPEALVVPTRLSYLALLCNATQRDQAWSMVCDLARQFDLPPPPPGAVHYSADFGSFRLKWERHTEFARYQFIVAGTGDDPFAQPAIQAAPADWVASLPGQTMVATHVALVRAEDVSDDYDAISARYFDGNILVGASSAVRRRPRSRIFTSMPTGSAESSCSIAA